MESTGCCKLTIQAALNSFFNSFSITAYEQNVVPDNAPYPYATYSAPVNGWAGEVAGSINLYYRETKLTTINAKAKLILDHIGEGGVMVPCTNGRIWIKKGSPALQMMSDPNDKMVRRAYIVITLEYLTL